MLINEKLIKFIFSKRNFLKFGGSILLITLAVVSIVSSILYEFYTDTYDKKYTLLIKADFNNTNLHKPDMTTKDNMLAYKCKLIGCKALSVIEGDSEYFYRLNLRLASAKIKTNNLDDITLVHISNRSLKTTFWSKYFTPDYNLIINYNNERYVLNDNAYILSIITYTTWILIILSTVFLGFTIINLYISYKNDIYEKGSYKMYLENKLQANVTEMIHHEVNAPLAIINTLVDNVRDAIVETHSKEEQQKMLSGFKYAIDRIESVMGLLSEYKQFKYSRNDANISDVIKHVVNNINKFKVGQVKLDFNNPEIFTKYSISNILGNGNIMNILHIIVNNAIEAKADKLLFTAVEVGSDFLELYVSDNGSGVRDVNNKVIKSDVIFEYGYSTKDMNGRQIISNSKLNKFLNIFGITIISTDTTRGIGLYMSRMLLSKVGGSIELYKTSNLGTTFKLTIPVQLANIDIHK